MTGVGFCGRQGAAVWGLLERQALPRGDAALGLRALVPQLGGPRPLGAHGAASLLGGGGHSACQKFL